MMAIGSQINGGKIHGAKPDLNAPGLSVNMEAMLGPEGLKVVCDYRSVLAEVLVGVMGNQNLEKVFPAFKSQRVGLASNWIYRIQENHIPYSIFHIPYSIFHSSLPGAAPLQRQMEYGIWNMEYGIWNMVWF